MRYRPVATPHEARPLANFSAAAMIRALDESRKHTEREQQLVITKLPMTFTGSKVHPVISVEISPNFTSTIALVVRERRSFLLFPYTVTTVLDLTISELADFADELEFFSDQVLAGDAFERVATSDKASSILTLRCNRGAYEIWSRPPGQVTKGVTIHLDLFGVQKLVGLLRSFGVSRKGWRELHLMAQ